ncbi:MerR family transcriptional regulator [uncultured Desulfobacter sp.]|uniref:MerR family transcriptional regulator n=1 Tax=uncultured Desulfobacter sp. TaxID=240139 RepID=UPI002AA73243|nr:MerR family transcriptional regulator [uncultured Desulfobacter sp.]
MSLNKPDYTTPELIKVIGVTRARLQQWVERGYVGPSIQKASGQGVKNLYSINDLYKVAAFKHLIEFGFSRERAGSIIGKYSFSFSDENNKAYHILVHIDLKETKENTFFFSFDDEDKVDEFFKVIKEGVMYQNSVFILNISALIADVNFEIKKLL